MKVTRIGPFILSIVLTSLVFAGDNSTWRPVVTLSFGPAWSDPGETQTLYLQPALPETFAVTSTADRFAEGEFFLGLQHRLARSLQTQLGLAVAATTNIPLRGDIWQDASPEFNNLIYAYKINQIHLAVKGKLLTDIYQLVQPYVSGSLGLGFNQAYHYRDTTKLFEVLQEPPFNSQVTTAFTYTLGIGLQRAVNTHWSVGVGYEFADWGKTALAPAETQLSRSGLSLSHIYTNELQFSLSFVA